MFDWYPFWLNKLFDVIEDGQVTLQKADGNAIPYMTKDITVTEPPMVIVHNGIHFVDTGRYNPPGFRLYRENFSTYNHKSSSE